MVIAVASKVGGDNPAEAYRIGQQYKGECSLPTRVGGRGDGGGGTGGKEGQWKGRGEGGIAGGCFSALCSVTREVALSM